VVVGRHQALRRHERGRAAAQADDRAHREFGQFGQGGGVEFQAGGFQLLGHLWQLLRHPHAFIGMGGGAQDGERDQGLFHCLYSKVVEKPAKYSNKKTGVSSANRTRAHVLLAELTPVLFGAGDF
jgi:hypothetical protein